MICGSMLLIVASLCAFAAEDMGLSKLIVQGEGKETAAPDAVTIELGVETRNASASVAAQENARLMNSYHKCPTDLGEVGFFPSKSKCLLYSSQNAII